MILRRLFVVLGVPAILVVILAACATDTTITSDDPDPSVVNQPVTVNYSVTRNGSPTGGVLVSDGIDSCTASVVAGSCTLTLTTPGVRTLTATYLGPAEDPGDDTDMETHTVLMPQEAIDNLILDVQNLVPPLTKDQADGLIAKLNGAKAKLDQEKTRPACKILDAFANQVEGVVSAGFLTLGQGQSLTDMAAVIKTGAGC